METRTLLDLPKRTKARIKTINGSEDSRERLLALGVLPGDDVELIGRAWFGSPLAIKLGKSNFIALRREHASLIVLEDHY
ncbi:MAG: ferrous iron transport protein A [Bdellovibrio sp.]|nr:ferrous iron transport protein A [Bdellovibrio sp.]